MDIQNVEASFARIHNKKDLDFRSRSATVKIGTVEDNRHPADSLVRIQRGEDVAFSFQKVRLNDIRFDLLIIKDEN